MKMGKYIVRGGRYIHQDDLKPCFLATRQFWLVVVPTGLTIWYFILLALFG